MPLTNEQIRSLLGMIAASEADSMECDGCHEQLAEFAETMLAAREVPEALQAVEVHLRQCRCCNDEFNALLEGLRALED